MCDCMHNPYTGRHTSCTCTLRVILNMMLMMDSDTSFHSSTN